MRNWDLNRGYRIYFNLHKMVFSVQAYDVDKKGWRLYQYADSLVAKGVKFKVSEAGRQRVLQEKRKNVHAVVICDDIEKPMLCNIVGMSKDCTYNPYIYGYFYDKETHDPIHELDSAYLVNKQIKYKKDLEVTK